MLILLFTLAVFVVAFLVLGLIALSFYIVIFAFFGWIAYQGYKLVTAKTSTPTQQNVGIGMMVFSGIVCLGILFLPDDTATDSSPGETITIRRSYHLSFPNDPSQGPTNKATDPDPNWTESESK